MAQPKAKNYKQLSDELAQILDWFESGDVELDKAIAKYKEANAIIAEMETYLKTAKNKIRKVTDLDQ